jgi:hypothetical protein
LVPLPRLGDYWNVILTEQTIRVDEGLTEKDKAEALLRFIDKYSTLYRAVSFGLAWKW